MNRVIKFRAWSPEGNRMMEPSRNILIDSYDGMPYFAFGFKVPDPKPDWVLMQFTGLKDIKGKDIYEGDVLTTYQRYRGDRIFYTTSYVEYNEFVAAWQFRYEGGLGNYSNGFLHDFDHEVIGNIYINPDLIQVRSWEEDSKMHKSKK